MKGRIMIARMMDAARMPEPLGMPENSVSQKLPAGAAAISGVSTWVAKKGAKTNRPHMP